MDEELDLEFELDEKPRSDSRFKKLAENNKNLMSERDAERQAREAAEAEKEAARKEADFYRSFAQSNAQYPAASEYAETIKEKVMSGYSVEDATVAVLAKEGKLNLQPIAQQYNPAGGSAITDIPTEGRDVSAMNLEEKRKALLDAINRGDISST